MPWKQPEKEYITRGCDDSQFLITILKDFATADNLPATMPYGDEQERAFYLSATTEIER